MRLGRDGDTVSLDIGAYQFPHITWDDYDSNWLLIDVAATVDGKSWETRDPCLLTWEVARLAAWLDALAEGEKADPEQHFIEPNLRFEFLGWKGRRARVRG